MTEFIIGFDPGTKLVGWAVMKMDGDLVSHGHWKLGTDKEDVWTRLARLPDLAYDLIWQFHPVAVACEITRPFGSKNLHTHLVLAVSIGDIHSQAVIQGCDWVPVNPAQVRATGLHKKNRRYVREEYWLNEIPTEDEADAIGICEWARRQIKSGLRPLRAQGQASVVGQGV